MKIGIDTFGCDHARSGLGSYLLSFTANIPSESEYDAELFGSELDRFTYTSNNGIPYKPVDVPDSLSAERFWHFTSSQKFALAQKYDAVIYPAPERVMPVSFKVPGVAVLNSILSSAVEGNSDWIQKLQIKRGLLRVHKIIAASKFIREDLISHGIASEKIEVVYNGIDHKVFYPPINLNSDVVEAKPFAIKKPYFIYGSRLSGPEKKHIELIKAFSLFKSRTGLPHRLVLAGANGAYSAQIHKAALDSNYASDIFLTGYFPHENFPALYAGADACLFPSVNEGVGLPVLEAMAVGIPVLCSGSAALPEVAGEAALFFNSDNIDELSACMEKIVFDNVLRADLVKKGLEWSKQFCWKNTVRQTFEIVKNAAQV